MALHVATKLLLPLGWGVLLGIWSQIFFIIIRHHPFAERRTSNFCERMENPISTKNVKLYNYQIFVVRCTSNLLTWYEQWLSRFLQDGFSHSPFIIGHIPVIITFIMITWPLLFCKTQNSIILKHSDTYCRETMYRRITIEDIGITRIVHCLVWWNFNVLIFISPLIAYKCPLSVPITFV